MLFTINTNPVYESNYSLEFKLDYMIVHVHGFPHFTPTAFEMVFPTMLGKVKMVAAFWQNPNACGVDLGLWKELVSKGVYVVFQDYGDGEVPYFGKAWGKTNVYDMSKPFPETFAELPMA